MVSGEGGAGRGRVLWSPGDADCGRPKTHRSVYFKVDMYITSCIPSQFLLHAPTWHR